MSPAPAGALGASLAPSREAQRDGESNGRAGAAGSPTAHLDSAGGGAAVAAPGSPPSPAASSNGVKHMHPAESKHSLASEDSELGKEGSSAGSIADSSSAGSGSGSSGLSPHYDANQDVILRLEFLRAAEIKVGGVLAGRKHRSLASTACGTHDALLLAVPHPWLYL